VVDLNNSVLDSVKAASTGETVDKPFLPCQGAQQQPCWKKFPKGAEPYEPKDTDVQRGWNLKHSGWMNVQQQHYGNCAVQTAQLLIRFGDLSFSKDNAPGYSEEQMEVLANCPKASGYSRSGGTPPVGSLNIYENAGMITCRHPQTPENVAKAVKAGYPVSTGHNVEDLWGQSKGGHRVATVGYLKDKDSGRITAFLVHDTGRDCLYYVPAARYQKSLKKGDMIIVVGQKRNCKDASGKAVKPGSCCLARYARRKEALAASLPEDQSAQAREAREQADNAKANYEFGRQMQLLAESTGDSQSAAAWKAYCERVRADWQSAYDKWKKAKADMLAKQEKITPMGANDSGAEADRKACADADRNLQCEEQRQPCPVCGK
jgi:hypothetical protein